MKKCDNYRPHPKDGDGTVFTGVCLFTPGGGLSQSLVPGPFPISAPFAFLGRYPSPSFFPRSLVPGLFQGDTPVPGCFPGLWSQGYPSLSQWRYPSPRWRYLCCGEPPEKDRTGVPPDRIRVPPARTGYPSQKKTRMAERVFAMRWAIFLLRSRGGRVRGTFLF